MTVFERNLNLLKEGDIRTLLLLMYSDTAAVIPDNEGMLDMVMSAFVDMCVGNMFGINSAKLKVMIIEVKMSDWKGRIDEGTLEFEWICIFGCSHSRMIDIEKRWIIMWQKKLKCYVVYVCMKCKRVIRLVREKSKKKENNRI